MEPKYPIFVIIPAYKNQDTIQRAIGSAHKAASIVLVDANGSHANLVLDTDYDGALFYLPSENKSIGANRNIGLEHAMYPLTELQGSGIYPFPYVGFLDGDDYLLEPYWELVSYLKDHEDADIVSADAEFFDDLSYVQFARQQMKYDFKHESKVTKEMLWEGSPVPMCSVVARKSWFAAQQFDEELTSNIDDDLWLRILEHRANWVYLDRIVYKVNMENPNRLTATTSKDELEANVRKVIARSLKRCGVKSCRHWAYGEIKAEESND